MEPVHVLRRRDRRDHRLLVERSGQRQLDEQAVHLVVGVQLRDEPEQLLLRRRGREAHVARLDARVSGSAVLAADVDVGGGVVADEHRREPDAPDLSHLGGDLGPNPLGERLPVHECRGHGAEG